MLRPKPAFRASLVVLAAVVSTAGCNRRGGAADDSSALAAAPEAEPVDSAWLAASMRANRPVRSGRTGAVIRVTAEADSAIAAFIRDSLDLEGWPAWITVGAPPRWRVNIAAPRDAAGIGTRANTIRLLRDGGFDARETQDLIPASGAVRLRGDLGTGSYAAAPVAMRPQMRTRLRWAHRPDGGQFLIVADAEGLDGAPEPDIFVTAGEEEGVEMSDPVWDVMPSPDWRYLAFSDAHIVSPSGDREDIDPARWQALATEVQEPVVLVRDVSFSLSEQATRFGFALPHIRDTQSRCKRSRPGGCPTGAPATAGGWRVRWLRDGSRAAFGITPRRVADDAPATLWTVVDPTDGQAHGTATDSGEFAAVPWFEGPTLDAESLDTLNAAAVWAGDWVVENSGAWIRIVEPDSLGGRIQIVGPGRALVATNRARHIAALVPRTGAKPGESPLRLVIYSANR